MNPDQMREVIRHSITMNEEHGIPIGKAVAKVLRLMGISMKFCFPIAVWIGKDPMNAKYWSQMTQEELIKEAEEKAEEMDLINQL